MESREELVGRLADHATRMAGVVSYEDAAALSAGAFTEFLPVDSVCQVRLTTEGALHVGARLGPLGEALAELPFDRLAAMDELPIPGAAWQRHVSLDDAEGSLEHALAQTGARTVVVTGLNGLGRLRGIIVLASRDEVTLSDHDLRTLELLCSLAVSVLRATMLVPNLRRHAAIDPLTGLWHRGAFNEAMIARRNSDRHALILIDIDHFKLCNDTRGHVEGDLALKAVADALKGVLRSSDAVFRLGGDEFAAIVEVDGPAGALAMGRRMHAAVADDPVQVTVSVGVALGTLGEGDAELLDRADSALYRVKSDGRDGVAIDRRPPRVGDVPAAA